MSVKLPQLLREYPFPPVTLPERMVWTASSMKLFRACKRKWFWKYILRLRPKHRDRHLVIGKAFHETLGEWYKGRRASMTNIVRRYSDQMFEYANEAVAYYDQDDYDKLTTTVRTFAGMMLGYATIYEKDRDQWDIVRDSIEAKFKVDCGEYDYAGKIDLITRIRKTKGNRLVEHKTASSMGESYIDRLPLDTQVRGYIFGAEHGLGIKVNHVIYDVVKKCKLRRKSNEDQDSFNVRIADDYIGRPEFYFYREPLMFARSDVEAFRYEMEQTHREYKNVVREGSFMDPRNWMPNDQNCNSYFRLCEYHRVCTTGLDRGTASMYEQGDDMHEELADDD